MQNLSPDKFFQYQDWEHQAIFAGLDRVWELFQGRLQEYIQASLKPQIQGEVSPGAYLEGDDIQIGHGSVVEAGAYLRGPLIIGENTEVRHGAYIRGNCLIGNDCVVGHTTELKNALFLDRAKAGHFAYIGDSILGNDVNLGAGTKLANFKLTPPPIKLRINGERISTELKKLGAILGDGVQTGCNSVCSPGTLLGMKSLVYPCQHVAAGYYADATVIK